jgi:hypothetical protein
MGSIGVGSAQFEPPLRQVTAAPDSAVLCVSPAAIGEKPPVVRIEMGRVPFAKGDARLVMVRHPRERKKPEGTQRQRKDDHIARPSVDMRESTFKRLFGLTVDGKRKGSDMAVFARCPASRGDLGCHADPRSGLGRLRADRMNAGKRRMRKPEIRISLDGTLQCLCSAGPC